MSQTTAEKNTKDAALEEKHGKYLCFNLYKEQYGIDISKVREIISYTEPTPVPQTPDFVEGVINLRGQVIPVINLRTKFDMPTAETDEQTCIIVVETSCKSEKSTTGLVVDTVPKVIDITEQNIQQTPQFGKSVNTDYILAVANVNSSINILLDIEKILEINDFSNAVKEAFPNTEKS